MPDPHNLHRFVEAQDSGNTYTQALTELRAGSKQGHWMWFIFPQIAGLGSSPMSQRFAIRSIAEAHAYLAHPVLGPRLRECTEAVLTTRNRSLEAIFGSIDALKFRSSMTLFAQAASDTSVFQQALDLFCNGQPDPATLRLLERA